MREGCLLYTSGSRGRVSTSEDLDEGVGEGGLLWLGLFDRFVKLLGRSQDLAVCERCLLYTSRCV